jgi:hypothetical protein
VLVVVVLAGAGTGWAVWHARNRGAEPAAGPSASATATPGPAASPTPSSSGDAPAGDPAPAQPDPGGGQTAQPGPGEPGTGQPGSSGGAAAGTEDLRPASVRVVYADWDAASSGLLVAAVVTDVVEDGGTCTVTASRDGAQVSVTGSATADATSTTCGEIAVPGSRLGGSGTWSVTVAYRSATAAGASAATDVAVP